MLQITLKKSLENRNQFISKYWTSILFCIISLHCSTAIAQSLKNALSFETQEEITAAGGVVNGTISLEPGLSGNAVNLSTANSLCFPAQSFIGMAQGTLQFWIKSPGLPGGIWEMTNAGTSKLWGAYRIATNGNDVINHELKTAATTSARISLPWHENSDWHFLVFTWSQTQFRTNFNLYIDGIPGSQLLLIGKADQTATSMLCIGRYATQGNSHAIYDERKTFDYVRTNTDIINDFWALFNDGCPLWPNPWRNPFNGADVDRDGVVNKIDALHVLSAIVSGETFNMTTCPDGHLPTFAYDANGDTHLNELDATSVVNVINQPLPPAERITLTQLRLLAHGDVNEDGALDGDDLSFILLHQGETVPIFAGGDITGDGVVNQKEIDIVRKYLTFEGDWSADLPKLKVLRSLDTD